MATWNDLVEADYRIGRIADAAERVVAEGDQHRDNADVIYTQAKRHLASLVGAFRGRKEVPPLRDGRPDLARTFAKIVAQPPPAVDPRTDNLLRSPDIYQLACTHVYDRLCQLYDWRHGWRLS